MAVLILAGRKRKPHPPPELWELWELVDDALALLFACVVKNGDYQLL